jgi:putative ABC transport system permease protein
VTIFVAVTAAMNTMSMNFRDRLHELAALKALGFSGSLVFGWIQLESLLLCGTGGLLGAMVPYVAFTHTPLAEVTVPLIQHLVIQPRECVQAMGVSLLVGVAAAVWPSWTAYRLKAVTALRSLE